MVIERINAPHAIGQRVRAGQYIGTVVPIVGETYMVALDRLYVTQPFDRTDLQLLGGAK